MKEFHLFPKNLGERHDSSSTVFYGYVSREPSSENGKLIIKIPPIISVLKCF